MFVEHFRGLNSSFSISWGLILSLKRSTAGAFAVSVNVLRPKNEVITYVVTKI